MNNFSYSIHGNFDLKLIGIAGKDKSKTAVAVEYIRQLSKRQTAIVNFGEPLDRIQEYAYRTIEPAHRQASYFLNKGVGGFQDPFLMDCLITWGRKLDPSMWVQIWQKSIHKTWDQGRLVICSDVGFDNEAEAIHALRGMVMCVGDPPEGLSSDHIDVSLKEPTIDPPAIKSFKSELCGVFFPEYA